MELILCCLPLPASADTHYNSMCIGNCLYICYGGGDGGGEGSQKAKLEVSVVPGFQRSH